MVLRCVVEFQYNNYFFISDFYKFVVELEMLGLSRYNNALE
jgi:hypothetical protein